MSDISPYKLEQAMSALLAARQRLLAEDPDIASDERLFSDMLEGEAGDAMEMLDRVLRASVHASDMSDAAQARAEEIAARYNRYKKRAEALRGVAFAVMDALELRRRELPDLTASIAAGRPSVMVTDEDALPEAFVKTERKADKTLIGAALKAGNTVPGATLSNSLPTLQVRTK